MGDAVAGLVPFRSLLCWVLQRCLIKLSGPLPDPHEASLRYSKTKGGGTGTSPLPYPIIQSVIHMWEGKGVDLHGSEEQVQGWGSSSAGHEGRQDPRGSLGSGTVPPTQSLGSESWYASVL